jgi:uncharacterized protein (DUF2147 family)
MITRFACTFALACLFAGALSAQSNSAIGLWKLVEPNKVVYIRTYEENGLLFGKVEKLVKGGNEDPAAKCEKCTGNLHDKPMKGLGIIWDMKKDGNRWTGGKILEPDSGKVYSCRLEAQDGGKKLSVRGSIAFLSKTQFWLREE